MSKTPDEQRPALDPAIEQYAADLRAAMSTFWHRSRRNLVGRRPNVTLARLEVLSLLGKSGKLSIGEIAARSEIHPSTLTRLVDALEKRKLVTRSVDRRDRRSITVGLSAAGRAELHQAQAVQHQLVVDALACLSAEDQARLFAAIPLLVRTAENIEPGITATRTTSS